MYILYIASLKFLKNFYKILIFYVYFTCALKDFYFILNPTAPFCGEGKRDDVVISDWNHASWMRNSR